MKDLTGIRKDASVKNGTAFFLFMVIKNKALSQQMVDFDEK